MTKPSCQNEWCAREDPCSNCLARARWAAVPRVIRREHRAWCHAKRASGSRPERAYEAGYARGWAIWFNHHSFADVVFAPHARRHRALVYPIH